VVVGRLAATAKREAAQAGERARVAIAREREAAMLAAAASSLLEGADVETQLHRIAQSGGNSGASHARVELGAAPRPDPGELAVRLPTASRRAWLYLDKDAWMSEDHERIALALGHLLDVSFERERLGA